MCGICGKLDSKWLCKKCEINIKKHENFQVDNYKENIEKYYNEHMYNFMYEGIIRKLIIGYKFNEKSYIYKTLSNYILKNEKLIENIKNYDIIIPIPISKQRKRERGYNQSLLIAREISKKTCINLENNVLYKTKNIVPQSTLNKEDRLNNIKNAYGIKNTKNIQNKKILLFDDIYTTGSTVNECSRILKENGAKYIGILTIAKD